MNSDDTLIRVENLGKKFCRELKKSLMYGIQDVGYDICGIDRSKAELRKHEFWANQGISFELKRGECLGLIGRNGAGKTTLLKLLNGLIKPDAGRIEIRGRVGALIALGAGFNPILTGRENLFINASVLGISRSEIESRLDEILDFADIGKFIDSPVQSYSSGMQVRLGFAVATALKPDVLLVDEVLAVGDTAFKVKCYNKIKELLPTTAVIFVSHNMFDVSRVATQVMVLAKGAPHMTGSVEEGIRAYNGLNREYGEKETLLHKGDAVQEVYINSLNWQSRGVETSVKICIDVLAKQDISDRRVRAVFFDESQQAVAEWDSKYHETVYHLKEGTNQLTLLIDRIRLRSGNYRIVLIVTGEDNVGYDVSIEQGLNIHVESEAVSGAAYKI